MKDVDKQIFPALPFLCEVVCAGLLQNVSMEHIKTTHTGSSRKSFSYDIEKIEMETYRDTTEFHIHLNRNSIYDLLPEGLFHQTLGSNRVKNVKDAVTEHKRFKEEEKQARKFFAPIEQMLFRYRVHSELTETDALSDIQNGKLNDSFYRFWRVDKKLGKAETDRMLQLLPYCHFIKGDLDSTTTALSYIINKPVSVSQDSRLNEATLENPRQLSNTSLGIDTVLGNGLKEQLLYWIFTIQEVDNRDMGDYTEGGRLFKLLQRFTEIFIPLEVDAEYDVSGVVTKDDVAEENILGYGSYL